MKIVFFGTPVFAVESLKQIIEAGYDVRAVVTAVDKPAGRGRKLRFSAVKEFAMEHNLLVLQPKSLKDEKFIEQLKEISPDLQVVVAFRFLPELVWSLPPLGTINLHASYLPDYRGAAPINWVLINGEKQTGVTTFFINNKIDTGNIILRQKVDIYPEDDAGSLHDRLMVIGAKLLVKTLELVESGKVKTIEQDALWEKDKTLHLAPKITKQMCKINWKQTPEQIFNFVRGLSPYPTAWTNMKYRNNKTYNFVKIFKVRPHQQKHSLDYGKIITDNNQFMKVAVKNGFVSIEQIQLPNKKKLHIKEFLKGFDASDMYFC